MTNPSSRRALLLFVAVAALAAPETLASDPPQEITLAPGIEVIPAQVISKTQMAPVFPPAAQAGRFSGAVTVEILIDVTGRVARARVVNSTHPNVGFEEAALDAVRKWLFRPAELNGDPVPFEAEFELTFDRRGTGILTPALLEGGPKAGFRHTVRWQSLDPNRGAASGPGAAPRTPAVSGGSQGVPSKR